MIKSIARSKYLNLSTVYELYTIFRVNRTVYELYTIFRVNRTVHLVVICTHAPPILIIVLQGINSTRKSNVDICMCPGSGHISFKQNQCLSAPFQFQNVSKLNNITNNVSRTGTHIDTCTTFSGRIDSLKYKN